jgi:transposase
MPPARFVGPLDAAAQQVLRERYRTTHDADERSQRQMILLSAGGKSVAEIAALTFFGEDMMLYWFDRYAAAGADGLTTAPRRGRPPKSDRNV